MSDKTDKTPHSFDSFKHEWWNPEGPLKSLHEIMPLRFSYFSSKITGGLKGKTILDIGCGGGLLSEEFGKSGAEVTGIDTSRSAIDAAKEHAEKACLKINYRVSTIAEFKKENPPEFDCIVCSEVLEHVDNLEGFLKDASALLKSNGFFFFSTINQTFKAAILAIFVAENILRWVPRGAHDYKKFIRPSLIVKILKQNSIEVEEIKGMSFDVAKISFKITNDTSVNYIGYGVKR